MPTTAVHYPATVTQDASAFVDWTNASNATTSNNSRASVVLTTGQQSELLNASGYDFSDELSATALVTAIYIDVEWYQNSLETIVDNRVYATMVATSANISTGQFPSGTSDTVDTFTLTNLAFAGAVRLAQLDVLNVQVGVLCNSDGTCNTDSIGVRVRWEYPRQSGAVKRLLLGL